MKSIISKAMMLVAVAAALLSFTSKFGGEGFEISLNGIVLLQQFGKDLNTVKILKLNNVSASDKLTIRYYHCGRIGKNRTLAIKDGQDKLIKEWRFKDAQTTIRDMSCSVNDFFLLAKNGNHTFNIYYSSSELPAGRMLTKVIFGNNSDVTRK